MNPKRSLMPIGSCSPVLGGIRDCMEAIRRLGCDQLLDQVLNVDRKPVLAICVGMQALDVPLSEENGGVACLDVLPGQVAFFGEAHQSDDGERLKVPHMGWNAVRPAINHPLVARHRAQYAFLFCSQLSRGA